MFGWWSTKPASNKNQPLYAQVHHKEKSSFLKAECIAEELILIVTDNYSFHSIVCR